MFNLWHEREGSKATYLRLVDAFYQYGRRDLIDFLCSIISFHIETMALMISGIGLPKTVPESKTEAMFCSNLGVGLPKTVPESKTEAMFRSNLEDIKSRFAILLRCVQLTLEDNHVTPQDVHAVLVGMFGC